MMRFARGSRRLFLLVALVALSSVVYSEARTKQASAAGGSPVVIAVDATSTTACQVTYHLNTRWHSTPPPGAKPLVPWTKTLPCAAGTIIKTAEVPLAQALAQHKRYAPLPAHPQAPTVAERAAIQAVLEAKHTSFASRPAAHAHAASDPMVFVAVDATTPQCRTQRTVTRGTTISTTDPMPCLPGTVMKAEQVPLSKALTHHWSYLPLSSATHQSIAALVSAQREALRRGFAPVSGMSARGAVTPTVASTCGYNASIYTSQYLEGDFTAGQVNYYVSRDCSTIVLDNSTTQLDGCYCDAMFWQETWYNEGSYPYCWTHYCWFGFFVQSIAPPYHVWQENYNATEDPGYDFWQGYSGCPEAQTWAGCDPYPELSMDFGNLD